LLFIKIVSLKKNKKMPVNKNLSIAHRWFDAFNAHNLEQLLALYDDNAEHFSPKLKIRKPETDGLIKGKNALRDWWQDAFDRLPTLNYKVTSLTANENRVFMEYIRKVENEEDMLVAEVLEIKDGKIVFSRVYHG
jgi:ketosteroid isomerase-like protein